MFDHPQVWIALICLAIGSSLAFRVWLARQAQYADKISAAVNASNYPLDLSDFVLLVQGHPVVFITPEGTASVVLSEELHAHPEHMMVAVRSRIEADAKRPGA